MRQKTVEHEVLKHKTVDHEVLKPKTVKHHNTIEHRAVQHKAVKHGIAYRKRITLNQHQISLLMDVLISVFNFLANILHLI